VKEMGIYKPSEILNNLNTEIVNSFRSGDVKGDIYDGMDLALICYNKKTGSLEYAGGYNPLWVVRGNEIEEIKADRFGIGKSSGNEAVRKFTNKSVEIRKGDTIYIFSDGYADQFGGEIGKKFKSKPMKELFLAIGEKSMEEQKNILNATLEAWKGEIEQVDDVLIIGRKF